MSEKYEIVLYSKRNIIINIISLIFHLGIVSYWHSYLVPRADLVTLVMMDLSYHFIYLVCHSGLRTYYKGLGIIGM